MATDTPRRTELFEDLESFSKLLEAEWYNGNIDEPSYLRLNRDLSGIIAKHRQPSLPDGSRDSQP